MRNAVYRRIFRRGCDRGASQTRTWLSAVGPSTAAALRDQGVTPEVVADPPRLFAMLEALASKLVAVRGAR